MKKNIFLVLISFVFLLSCKDRHSELADGLYAEIETNKGTIILDLDYKNAPITVANFISLTEGNNTFVANQFKNKPFYNGLKFHRVIKDFMIQGGDPLGDGSGDTGYKFKDEITDLKFDKGGILAMANSGPGTNSSQFFITHIATPWLDNKHTIFGSVVANGMEVVNKIEQNDDIKKVTIIRKGAAAKKFDALKIFTDFFTHEAENIKKQTAIESENKRIFDASYKVVKEKKVTYFENIKKNATVCRSGLLFAITSKGKGKKPIKGATIYIQYAGFLENGDLFDSSIAAVANEFGKFDKRRDDAQQYTPIPFEFGKKDGMIPGFLEGIEKMSYGDKAILFIPSNLGYGAQGAGGVIPANANLIFEVELVENRP